MFLTRMPLQAKFFNFSLEFFKKMFLFLNNFFRKWFIMEMIFLEFFKKRELLIYLRKFP